ncbi:glycosyltransferase, partial [Candidatus Parcubacteria bacterium]
MQPLSRLRNGKEESAWMRNDRLSGSNGMVYSGARGRLDGASTGFRRPRIALYSHDTMGLGHMRRNLLIATALTRSEPRPIVLMIAGAREAAAFAMPAGVDCVTLPAFGKQTNGQYHARSLDVSLKSLVALRANT